MLLLVLNTGNCFDRYKSFKLTRSHRIVIKSTYQAYPSAGEAKEEGFNTPRQTLNG